MKGAQPRVTLPTMGSMDWMTPSRTWLALAFKGHPAGARVGLTDDS